MLAYKSHIDEITSAILVCLQREKGRENILKEVKRTFLFIYFLLICSSYKSGFLYQKKSFIFSFTGH